MEQVVEAYGIPENFICFTDEGLIFSCIPRRYVLNSGALYSLDLHINESDIVDRVSMAWNQGF